jgi:phage-related protein
VIVYVEVPTVGGVAVISGRIWSQSQTFEKRAKSVFCQWIQGIVAIISNAGL